MSSGYNKSQMAASSLQMAAADAQLESRALDSTLAALNDLVNKPPVDLRFQFQQFSNNLDQLIAAARRNDVSARRLGERIGAYFESWDKELVGMNYEAIRTRSEARKAEVTGQFDSVYGRYHETQAAVRPLVDYLADIRKALKTDLTLNGLEAMKSAVTNANANAAKVQTALAKLAPDLSASGTQMSSVTVQTAQP